MVPTDHASSCSPTCGAAQTLALLPPLGLAENVDDQGGKLSGVKAGQLLSPLQGRKGQAHVRDEALYG
jgi:hypothetical protein